jgi:hypothetical protein
MQYFEPKYRYTYGPRKIDIVILFSLVSVLFAGSFELINIKMGTGLQNKTLTSIALIYLSWLFIASWKQQLIRIEEEGIEIPSTWIPGVLKNKYSWNEVLGVEFSSRNKLETICLLLEGNKVKHIYTKGIDAFYNGRMVREPSIKLVTYIVSVIEREQITHNKSLKDRDALKRVP